MSNWQDDVELGFEMVFFILCIPIMILISPFWLIGRMYRWIVKTTEITRTYVP